MFKFSLDTAMSIAIVALASALHGPMQAPVYLLTTIFVVYYALKVILPPYVVNPKHSIVYGITLCISGTLCYLMYSDNSKSWSYGLFSFLFTFITQSFILSSILKIGKK